MSFTEQRFYLGIQKVILLLKDLELILSIAKQNIDIEKKTTPYLNIPMLDNYLNIVKSYRLNFENLNLMKINEMDLNTINSWQVGFSRSFENPLLNSEDWYQRIVLIEQGLNQSFREINDFLLKQNC